MAWRVQRQEKKNRKTANDGNMKEKTNKVGPKVREVRHIKQVQATVKTSHTSQVTSNTFNPQTGSCPTRDNINPHGRSQATGILNSPHTESQVTNGSTNPQVPKGSCSHVIRGLLLNIRSIRNKFDELESLVNNEHFDIIAITETFISDNLDLPTEYQLPNFKFFSRNRTTRGGGVALYCRNELNPIVIETSENENVEHLCVQITAKTKKICVSVVYRRPSQILDTDTDMYASLQNTLKNNDAIILGDFNLPEINWQDFSFVESESRRLINFTEDNFLYQHVTEPTRGSNILDLIFTNQEYLVQNTKVREHLATCDHNMIEFEINNEQNPLTESVYVPNFGKADYIVGGRLV